MAFHRIKSPERLHALLDAILLIEQDANLTKLLKSIVENATKLVGARYGALGVLSRDGHTLSNFITYGLSDEQIALIGDLPKGRGVLGETIRVGHPLRVDDLATYSRRSGFPENHPPMTQFLGVPVRTSDGEVFGNLYLTDLLNGGAFSVEDEDLVAGFGRAAGLVIEQAKLRNQVRDMSIGEERERLARDLHDTVIQRLFGVGLSLQIALNGLSDESLRQRIDTAVDDLNTTIHEIRTTIFEIDQEHTDDQSLKHRIEVLILEMETRLGVQAKAQIPASLDEMVDANCAHHAMLALREMLSNVVRHSQATNVDVNVTIADNLLTLNVDDNGIGFEFASGVGHGLNNLTSRARDLGGDCTIRSEVGHGTCVHWTANRLD